MPLIKSRFLNLETEQSNINKEPTSLKANDELLQRLSGFSEPKSLDSYKNSSILMFPRPLPPVGVLRPIPQKKDSIEILFSALGLLL